MFYDFGLYVENIKLPDVSAFERDPCERRLAYRAPRSASGWGSAAIQVEVVEALYLPQRKCESPARAIVSTAFLSSKESSNYALANRYGKLVNVSLNKWAELPNVWASQMARGRVDRDPVMGQFYWVPKSAERQTWWRTSVRYDALKMPDLIGQPQGQLRVTIQNRIASCDLGVGPFFVETVSHEMFGHWSIRGAWFDIYAPTTTALVAIVSTF